MKNDSIREEEICERRHEPAVRGTLEKEAVSFGPGRVLATHVRIQNKLLK